MNILNLEKILKNNLYSLHPLFSSFLEKLHLVFCPQVGLKNGHPPKMSTAAQSQLHDGISLVWHKSRPSPSSCAKHDCNNNGVPFKKQSTSRHCLARHNAAHPRKWPKHLQLRQCPFCWPPNNRISGDCAVQEANTWPHPDGTVFGQIQSATTAHHNSVNLLLHVCLLLFMVLTLPSWMPGMSR